MSQLSCSLDSAVACSQLGSFRLVPVLWLLWYLFLINSYRPSSLREAERVE